MALISAHPEVSQDIRHARLPLLFLNQWDGIDGYENIEAAALDEAVYRALALCGSIPSTRGSRSEKDLTSYIPRRRKARPV